MQSLHHAFLYVLRWNAFESVIYNVLFLCHHLLLYRSVTQENYGFWATLFSFIYLTVSLMNLGLDDTLGTFLAQWTSDKRNCLRFIYSNLIPNCLIGMILAFIFYLSACFYSNKISFLVLFFLLCIIVTESAKKTVKASLQLIFKNNYIALAEIATIISYMLLVWSSYWYFGSITLYTIFIPMLIVSLASLCYLLTMWYAWFGTLPHYLDQEDNFSAVRIAKNRALNYIHTLNMAFTSSNAIVIICSYYFGFCQASTLKIISSIAQAISAILHKVFGNSSTIIFAHSKKGNNTDIVHHFIKSMQRRHNILLGIILFLCINYYALAATSMTTLPWFAILYCIILVLDNGIIMHERWLITYETNHFFIMHSTQCAIAGMAYFLMQHNPLHLLYLLLLLRTATYGFFVWFSRRNHYALPSYN